MTDLHDEQLNASLQRLPHWEPPADFARKLAAAAARQVQDRPTPAARPASHAWDAITAAIPQIVIAGLVAVLLVALPWDRLAQHPEATATLTAALLGVAGLWLTLRSLRS